jgi:hypothetical protein
LKFKREQYKIKKGGNMADIDELEKYYLDETGNNFDFLSKYSIPKTEASTLVLCYDNCYYNVDESINWFINIYRKVGNYYKELYPYLKEFYNFYTKRVFGNIKHEHFFELCAKVYLNEYRMNSDLQNYPNELFVSPIKHTSYVDLISGFNFLNFYPHLCKDNTYYLVDKSIMTCKCLKIQKEKNNIENVIILNKDVFDISEKDFNENISVIRVNNVWRYIYDFDTLIEKFKSMIMQNGIFLFQEYSTYKLFFQQNSPYQIKNICSLFNNWKQEFIFDINGQKIFDSLIFRK